MAELTSEREWLKHFFPANYSGDQPPVAYGTGNTIEPAMVYCVFTPQFVTTISMKTMDFDVDILLSIEWNDLRLNYVGHEDLITSPTYVPAEVAMKMWTPWLIFENANGTDDLLITPEVIRIAPLWTAANRVNKVGINIYYRKTFRFPCQLNFAAYPFDIQHCTMVVRWDSGIEPFNSVAVQLTTVDTPSMITVPPGFRLTSFKIENGLNTTISSPRGIMVLIRKSMVFVFERVFAQHLMLIFVPSVLIVMLSWVSFWLDVGKAAPRVALGLTTILTLSTQFNTAQRDLPPVADIKALDIWMFTCIFMVFSSLLEFFLATTCQNFRPTNVVYNQNKVKPMSERVSSKMENIRSICYKMQRNESTNQMDYLARIIFPLSFLLFNLVFWSYFLRG